MQEGKGGFNMNPEDWNKDFYDTLGSYLASAMKGHLIVEYTMGEVTVHGQTEYTVHRHGDASHQGCPPWPQTPCLTQIAVHGTPH